MAEKERIHCYHAVSKGLQEIDEDFCRDECDSPQKGAKAECPELVRPQLPEEIERKFLIGALPEDLAQYPSKEISQGYLAITEDGTEVRLRRKGSAFFLTVKSGSGETRAESEMTIAESQYDSLWPLTEGMRIEKTRYEIPYGEHLVELDVYHGDLEGLITAEVEFGSEQSSMEFIAPEWFGEEVTEDKSYKNQSLALHGIPHRP